MNIPETNGHEQSGTRPGIVIAETQANISVIIPLTSNLQALRFPYTIEIEPSEINGLTAESVALVFQIREIAGKIRV